MIPIADSAPRFRKPWVTLLLIAVNATVYALQSSLPAERVAWLFSRFGLQPADLFDKWHAVAGDPGLLASAPLDFVLVGVAPLVTYQFLHAGPMHLLGNMVFLWVAGDNVEGRLGHLRYFVFYLSCGIIAALLHSWFVPASPKSLVGASGAIAGVLGAYLVLFPKARVLLLVPIVIFFTIVECPAWLVLTAWFALQIPPVQGVLGWLQAEGVAWWAHVGGFLAGIVMLPLFLLRNPRPAQSRSRSTK